MLVPNNEDNNDKNLGKEDDFLGSYLCHSTKRPCADMDLKLLEEIMFNFTDDYCCKIQDTKAILNPQQQQQQFEDQKPPHKSAFLNYYQGTNFRVLLTLKDEGQARQLLSNLPKYLHSFQKGIRSKKIQVKKVTSTRINFLISKCKQNYLTKTIKLKVMNAFRLQSEEEVEVQKLYKSDPISSGYSSCEENEQQQKNSFISDINNNSINNNIINNINNNNSVWQPNKIVNQDEEELLFQKELMQRTLNGESLQQIVSSCSKDENQLFYLVKNLQVLKNAQEIYSLRCSNNSLYLEDIIVNTADLGQTLDPSKMQDTNTESLFTYRDNQNKLSLKRSNSKKLCRKGQELMDQQKMKRSRRSFYDEELEDNGEETSLQLY